MVSARVRYLCIPEGTVPFNSLNRVSIFCENLGKKCTSFFVVKMHCSASFFCEKKWSEFFSEKNALQCFFFIKKKMHCRALNDANTGNLYVSSLEFDTVITDIVI